jgi:hypothetical protein
MEFEQFQLECLDSGLTIDIDDLVEPCECDIVTFTAQRVTVSSTPSRSPSFV